MADKAWKGFVGEYIQGDHNSSVNNIVKELLDKKVTLLELVEELGPYLTSEEKHVRCNGTQLLSDVLHRLPRSFLSQKEVEVLVEFYCNRMNDHFTVAPHVIYGMVSLSLQPHLSDEGVMSVARSVFAQVSVQSMQQAVRQNVYNIFINFLERKREVLKTMGDEFLIGIIQAIDGEKDPRCLTIAFRCMEIIALNFTISTYAEEIFEVVACYFPIDFTPPPNDPKKVTKEELIQGLRRCLCASSKFAEFCLPLLMEKISSSIPSAKLDAFLTLAAAAEVYGASALDEFVIPLWSEIRREVFSPHSENLEGAALSALTAIVTALAYQPLGKRLKPFCDDIFKDCRRHIVDPELQLIHPSVKLLQASAQGSEQAATIITHHLIPLLLQQFHSLKQVEQRKVILDVLCNFIKTTSSKNKEIMPIKYHKSVLHPIVSSLMLDDAAALRLQAVLITDALLVTQTFYEEAEKVNLAEQLAHIMLGDSQSNIRKNAIMTVNTLCKGNLDIVRDVIVPRLLDHLQKAIHSSNPSLAGGEQLDESLSLAALSQIACRSELLEPVAPCLLSHIESLSTHQYKEDILQKALYLCDCLQKVLACSYTTLNIEEFLMGQVLHRIFVLTIRGSLYEPSDTLSTRWELVQGLAPSVANIMARIKQTEGIIANTVGTFLMGDISFLGDDVNRNPISFQPLKVTSPSYQTQLCYLLSAVVCSVRREDSIPNLPTLMTHLQDMACKCAHAQSALSAAKCFAGILNKSQDDSVVESIIESTCQQLQAFINDDTNPVLASQSLVLWSWMTKALVLRGHHLQAPLISKLLECLKQPALAEGSANGFRVILDECEDVMTSSMHATVRLMYKQRFFLQTAPLIVQGFKDAPESQSAFYLAALSHMLRHLPKQVMGAELPPLLPLLVRSLACGTVDVQVSTLTTITLLLGDQPQLLVGYLSDMLPHLIALATYRPSMSARCAALRCIGKLTCLPLEALTPHQIEVTRRLRPALDDHKRLVRKEAVETLSLWHLLGS